jgi:hypothetical protein
MYARCSLASAASLGENRLSPMQQQRFCFVVFSCLILSLNWLTTRQWGTSHTEPKFNLIIVDLPVGLLLTAETPYPCLRDLGVSMLKNACLHTHTCSDEGIFVPFVLENAFSRRCIVSTDSLSRQGYKGLFGLYRTENLHTNYYLV